MMRKRFFFSRWQVPLALFPLVISLCQCTKGPQSPSNTNEILLGEYGALTGSESTFGVETHKGIELAIDDKNAAGGIKGKKLKLISYDDEGKSEVAVTAVTRLITKDKVLILLGESVSSRSIAAGIVAQRYQIPMIAPSSTNPKVTEVGDYIFRVCFIDPFQGLVMAKFSREHLKAKTAAILRDVKSDYSVGLSNFFKTEFINRGGKILVDTTYSGGDIDFKSQLTQISKANPEILFIPGYYTEVGLIARQAKELHLKGVLLGGDGWDSSRLSEIGGVAIEGGYFSNHYFNGDKDPAIVQFVSRFKTKYGIIPGSSGAMGYEAAKLAIDALERAPSLNPKDIRKALAETVNFRGITGKITLDAFRNAQKPAVILKVSTNGNFDFVTKVSP